jgi:hypothetical protein
VAPNVGIKAFAVHPDSEAIAGNSVSKLHRLVCGGAGAAVETRRVISVRLRRFFPDTGAAVGDDYPMVCTAGNGVPGRHTKEIANRYKQEESP